ncbi:MAG: 1-deoxy-D-xylulose-5-phosphate synthase, partial [Firmicutes bacterium]|nr:1-deoxy-D-xylulose-5-phosphate synthase [Bacillota bacterium]
MYLDNINENLIDKIKKMDYEELDLLAVEIREFLIKSVSETGGHFASNLGAVELTIALHKVFDSPKDKIVFDVGHQSYVHKIITGRKDFFPTLRQLDGLSGFPKRSESIHDMYDSGHASTSVSAALGYAKARDLKGEDYSCIAVLGDGALTGGVAYEALNFAGADGTPLIVVLNDNEMSIDSSKGGINTYLQKLRSSNSYLKFKSNIKNAVEDNPKLYNRLEQTRDIIKGMIMPTGIFEDLGFKYFGPIDGHNIKELCEALELAKKLKRPVVVHVMTKKGKGFLSAEKNPAKYHGVGKFDPATAGTVETYNEKSYSEIFGKELVRLATKDERIVAISAAMVGSTGLSDMHERFPERCIDVGIAEQNAVSFAAGLALNGMRPVIAVYSTFLQRAYDEIITEVALMNLPVVFAIDRAGVTGADGETHQGNFDISYLSSMPNMTVLAPKDGTELREMLQFALSLDGPCAIRYPKENDSDLSLYASGFMDTNAELLGSDGSFAIIAVGSMVREALKASEILRAQGIDSAVYNLRRIKP